jgi:hypothetical protein
MSKVPEWRRSGSAYSSPDVDGLRGRPLLRRLGQRRPAQADLASVASAWARRPAHQRISEEDQCDVDHLAKLGNARLVLRQCAATFTSGG